MGPVMTALNRTSRMLTARCLHAGLLTALALATLSSAAVADSTPQALWDAWESERFVSTPAPCLRPAELTGHLEVLAARHPEALRLEEVGRSVAGRPIHLLTLGSGPLTILLWSQMHGDEPSATPALLDIADYLLRHAEEPEAAAILEGTTLRIVPMLNPDGAELYQRRNLQGIDINRDALNLATPEGRLLKHLRDQYEPMLGFNLHDQNRRTAVGDTGLVAANAVLAVAGDEANTLTPGRSRAKRACAAITTALAPFMPGRMARYDEDWSPRAFGDNITAWGTPVVLIESGGLPAGHDFTELTRLNFVAILSVLGDLVHNDLADHDPQIYEDLPRNNSDVWTDVAIRGGTVVQPGGEPYRADLSFNRLRDDRTVAGCPVDLPSGSRIVEIGDNRFLAAGEEIDATDGLLTLPLEVGVRGWAARDWLDASALDQLTRLAVGTVAWEVEEAHVEDALARAASVAGVGRARLVVTTEGAPVPPLVLDAPPEAAPSTTLDAILTALTGDSRSGDAGPADATDPLQALQELWPAAHDERPHLRRGRAASLLLWSPAPDGVLDPATTRLTAMWIDGVRIQVAP